MLPRTFSWIEPILERYERPLLQYAGSIVGNGENARDVVQDTFLRLAQHGEVEADRLAPWLFTVCRNRALDIRRKEDRVVAMSEDAQDDISSTDPCPATQLDQKEQTARLMHLLQHLPENQREVLRLRFQCDLSYKEISEITKLGVSNVGFLIHTGIKRLRQLWPMNLEANP